MIPPEGQLLEIGTNTQGTVADVKIGVGNINESDTYTAEDGKQAKGITAGLWISVRDPGAPGGSVDSKLRVHAGQKFEAGSGAFEVQTVTKRDVRIMARPKPKP